MASDKFQYTPLYKVMEPPRSGGTFEVVFRGSESLEEPFEMNEMAIIETAYDSSGKPILYVFWCNLSNCDHHNGEMD